MEPSGKTTITLKTMDEEFFEVEKSVVMEMVTIKNFLDEGDDDNSSTTSKLTMIPVPAVSSNSLSKIITYIEKYLELEAVGAKEDTKKAYDAKFMEELSNEELKELILAVNYLDVEYFLDKLNQAAANLIKNKSVEFVRDFFGIESDFTPDEEAKLRQENSWAFEDLDKDT